MNIPELSAKRQQLEDACIALEVKAGITKAMEQAREGRFIALGAFGEDVSPDEYFADEYDHFRGKARNAYFAVSDAALRGKLIATQRSLRSLERQSYLNDVDAAGRAVSQATAKTRSAPWVKAAAVAISTIAAGYWIFGVIGAIAGAVAGFFLGGWILSSMADEARTDLEQARKELDHARKEHAQNALWPECFSEQEERTGNRDEKLDREFAHAKRRAM